VVPEVTLLLGGLGLLLVLSLGTLVEWVIQLVKDEENLRG